jgi:hypothetical protein
VRDTRCDVQRGEGDSIPRIRGAAAGKSATRWQMPSAAALPQHRSPADGSIGTSQRADNWPRVLFFDKRSSTHPREDGQRRNKNTRNLARVRALLVCVGDLPPVLGLTLCYGWYCWSIERTVSSCTTIQTPLSSGSNNFSLLVPLTMAASWETVIGVPVGAFVITVTCVSAGTL